MKIVNKIQRNRLEITDWVLECLLLHISLHFVHCVVLSVVLSWTFNRKFLPPRLSDSLCVCQNRVICGIADEWQNRGWNVTLYSSYFRKNQYICDGREWKKTQDSCVRLVSIETVDALYFSVYRLFSISFNVSVRICLQFPSKWLFSLSKNKTPNPYVYWAWK